MGLEAATHGDGAAAQPASTAGAEREEGLLVQAGEGSPLHSRGKLELEEGAARVPGPAVPTDPEREAQLPLALFSVPWPHGARPAFGGESHTLQGCSMGPIQHSRAASQCSDFTDDCEQ